MNLDPVRAALVDDACRDADGARELAGRDAAAAVGEAHRRAQQLLDEARAEGEREGRATAAIELARARRGAREVVLRARRDAYDRARVAARDAASALRGAPGYGTLIDALTDLARGQLGDGAIVSLDDHVGGVIARAGSRTVDYRLPAVADRCFAAAAPRLEGLWR